MAMLPLPPRQLVTPGRATPAALLRLRGVSNYVRVYYSVVDDERFVGIYGTPHLATWLRLLLIADAIWPASAPIPASESRASVKALAARGLIDLLDAGRFRIHGLDAERERRRDSAAVGGRARQRSVSERSANAAPSLSLAKQEQSKAKPSTPRPLERRDGLPHVTPTVLDAWLDTTGRTLLGSGAFAQDRIDDACRRHSEAKVVRAIYDARAGFDHIPDASAMTAAVRNLLDPFPDSKHSKQPATDTRDAERGRRAVQATKKRTHDLGYHADEPDPMCDACKGGKAA